MTTDIGAVPDGASASARLRDQDVRILQRVRPLESWPRSAGDQPVTKVAVWDCETTGLDCTVDKVLDIAVAIIAVDEGGLIVAVEAWGESLNDPGIPIPPEITRLTGLRDKDVERKRINPDKLALLVGQATWSLAHHSNFDRSFVEAVCPAIAAMPWACSLRDGDWAGWGFDSKVLGYLLTQIGLFNQGSHRAMADVVSLVNLLAHKLDDGTTVIGRILAKAKRPTWKVEATGAPYAYKDALRRRGYRWSPLRKVWWTECDDDTLEAEKTWLAELFEPFEHPPTVTRLDARSRYR